MIKLCGFGHIQNGKREGRASRKCWMLSYENQNILMLDTLFSLSPPSYLLLWWYNTAWLFVSTWGGNLPTSGVSDTVQATARDRMLDWMDHWSVPAWRFPCPCSKSCVKFFYPGTLSGTTSGIYITVSYTNLLYQEQLSI